MNAHDRDALIKSALTPAPDTAVPAGLADEIQARLVATPQRPPGLVGWLSRPATGAPPSSALRPSTIATLLLLTLLAIAAVLVVAQRRDPAGPTDILTYHGNPAQTGVMPGPGPAGEPRLEWHASLPGPMGALTMPIVYQGRVYLADQRGTVTVVDEATGAPIWQSSGLGPIAGTPVVEGDLLVLGTQEGGVVALDPTSGVERWRQSTGTEIDASLTAVENGVLVGGRDGLIRRLLLQDGREGDRLNVRSAILRSPAIAGGGVYAVGDGGLVVAFDAATGAERWRRDLGDGEMATPAVADGTVFVSHGAVGGDEPYEIVALDVVDGVPRWRWRSPTLDRLFVGAVAGGFVYPSSEDDTVYRLDAATGQGGGWYRTRGDVGSLPTIVDDVMYVSSADGTVHAVDVATGAARWTRPVEGAPTMPVVTGGRVIVGTSLGEVVALGSR